MFEFDSVTVSKTTNNDFFIEWEMVQGIGLVIDDWNFEIFWSNDPVSGFVQIVVDDDDPIIIDGAIAVSYIHLLSHYDFNKDRYYKVLAIKKDDETDTTLSNISFSNECSNGIHEVMRYNEELLYSNYHGNSCLIIKAKSWGTRCPDCWSETRRQRTRTNCSTCNGTGFATGYFQPISKQISFDSDPKKSDSQKEWENNFDTKRARLSNYPLVRPKDLIFNINKNKRYVITNVETTKFPKLSSSGPTIWSKNNCICSQLLTLEELNTNDNQYNINVDNIPSIPPI